MLAIEAPSAVRTMMVLFRRGEYVIEGLRELFKEKGIDAALITSGVGALDICNLHTITYTGLPPKNHYFSLEGPLEVGSLQGSVTGGEPHIHVVLHDVANDRIYSAHMEPGSRCCYRVNLGLIVLDGVKTKRVIDPETNLVYPVPVDD